MVLTLMLVKSAMQLLYFYSCMYGVKIMEYPLPQNLVLYLRHEVDVKVVSMLITMLKLWLHHAVTYVILAAGILLLLCCGGCSIH